MKTLTKVTQLAHPEADAHSSVTSEEQRGARGRLKDWPELSRRKVHVAAKSLPRGPVRLLSAGPARGCGAFCLFCGLGAVSGASFRGPHLTQRPKLVSEVQDSH